MNGKRLLTAIALGAGLGFGASPAVLAESNLAFGAGGSANARLDFRITIPRFLFFRVGTAGTTVDLVDFDFVTTPPTTALGDGTPLNATSGGAVSVALITNAAGAVSIGADSVGPLTNTAGPGTISFTEILTADGGTITAPTLADGPSAPALQTAGAASLADTWTFTYANTTVPEEGTYGGAGVGTVTYTATLP